MIQLCYRYFFMGRPVSSAVERVAQVKIFLIRALSARVCD